MLSSYVRNRILKKFEHTHYFNSKPSQSGLEAIDTGKREFPLSRTLDTKIYLPKRMHRYLVAKKYFPEAFKGTVIDVGDRNGSINDLVDGTVASLDKNNASLETFDWDKTPLPFMDKNFDAVFCLDTLEHIADIHGSFEDLLRVSKRRVVVSLPNCWRKNLKEVLLGRSTRTSYGIPVERPMDRHRWYMNTEDIEDFYFYRAHVHGYEVAGLVLHAPHTWKSAIPHAVVRYLLPEHYFKNFLVSTVFVHLVRR